ncbi:topoisomerase I binding, arginine/serine-rich a [Phyllopteryx taeniolatus]|uniref:topoisomerase I binding, arginine/serine-rich a n=1 Tax=Phyllopteryx taeniolatus TaxID=161469 RepID=UPI002AD4B7BA|nr:topoisomerase I binding, arginine/serine-rich a [Phyllopteryx taeniolatus]
MSAIKLALQQNQKRDRRKSPEAKSAEVSPDSKCPICLDVFNNIAYLDICLHKFCFRCIHEWSKNKAECPLCKQPFNSIYHSIKSEQDFKQYDLKPVTNGSFGMFGGVRFRYRTTLTGMHRQRWGRTSPPPDNGVIFESTANPPQQRQTRYIRRMMTRMAAKRRAASEGRMFHNVRELEMVNFRRELYRQGLRVRAVRDGGRSRDTSAEFYRKNPACLHRLIPWLKRELVVLYGAHGSLVNIVQHIIMSRITRMDMEDRAIQEELWPFLQGRTEHFLHEFISFAKSPFNMEAYDQHATYEGSAHSSNSDISSNSSVIAISEDEHVDVDLEPPRTPGYAPSNLSHSLWDDETPGPSYSTTAERSLAGRESVHDSDSDSSVEDEAQEIEASPPQGNATRIQVDECLSSASDDCVIVAFVKPSAERTPELVQLSSDEYWSDDAKEVPPLPQHVRFDSDNPSPSPRSEPSGADRCHHFDAKERHGTLKSKVYKAPSESERKDRGGRERSSQKRGSNDRKHRRKRSSAERRRRSPVTCHIRERDYYYSNSRDWISDSKYKRKESDFHHQAGRKHSDRRSRSRSRSRESRRRERRRSKSRTCSSSPSTRRSNHEKPGGKRKYKTRHLENPPCPKDDTPTTETKPEDGKEERSPSVRSRRHKKKKKKHKKKSRRHRSTEKHSPITIDSDSDHADDTRAGTSSKDPSPINDAIEEPNNSICGLSL